MPNKTRKHKIEYKSALWSDSEVVQGEIDVYLDEMHTYYIAVYAYSNNFEKVCYNFNGKDYSTKDAFFTTLKDNGIYCEQIEVSCLTLSDNIKEPTELFWQFYLNQNIFHINKSTEIEYD